MLNAQHIPYYELVIKNFNSTIKKSLEQSPSFANATITFPKEADKMPDSIKGLSIDNIKGKLLLKFYYRILIDTTNAQSDISFFDYYGYYSTYGVYYKFQFEVSNIETKEILDQSQCSNSFTWVKRSNSEDGTEAVIEASRQAADLYARRLAPFWSTEERMLYYSGNQLVRKGYNSFCEDDLQGATVFWNQLYNTGTRKLASLAAHNIALVYEMQDDLDACENWLVKSIQSKLHKETQTYLAKIRKRKLARISLEQQTE
jgi:hypothetical protein